MTGTNQTEPLQPLEGVTILDFTHALAGPLCTLLLSDYGARVIKIERPGSGDVGRHMSMAEEPPIDPVQGATGFLGLNRNKESVALDLSTEDGKRLAKELSARCDVLIENFRPGVMDRLGLGYEDVKRVNPNVIYCDISAFGDGPRAQDPGMDLVIQARAGTIAITGEPGGTPMRPGVSVSDVSCGMLAANGILLALLARNKNGTGQRVDLSLYDSTLFMLMQYAAPILNSGVDIGPMGHAHPQLAPYQAFQTADGWIFIGCGTDNLFRRLCDVVDLPEMADDERFKTNQYRVKNRKEMESMLNQKLQTQTAEFWETGLHDAGIPVSPIVTPGVAYTQAREEHSSMVETMQHPHYGTIHLPGRVVRLAQTPGRSRRYPPRLGEDTGRILREMLNTDDNEIDRLTREGVIAQYQEGK